MSKVGHETYESATNMGLMEPISPTSTITKSPSSDYGGFPREEGSENTNNDHVIAPEAYNPLTIPYQNVSYICIFSSF